ncbi:calcium/calmodulin-dependent protein kinase I [Angomonas deanei]|nr:calcium/calmodulin-dependent protein kinase I [Angomonas deanei]|eukprot:EPY34820.1 calcium/calmodulin-dependent protein kinase I [Angomonas deanei]
MAQPSKGHFKESYTLKEKLGKGAYAVVYSCESIKTKEMFAVKVVDKTKAGPKDIDDLAHEINIMSQIGYHPHVVQMIEYFSTERHLYIVLDLLNGGMLFDRIVQMRHYSESNASILIRNFLSALDHIHSKGIIHRDLKPENLLLRNAQSSSGDEHLTDVCLADFGLAGYIPSQTCCGSPSYIAPEVINVGYVRKPGCVSYNEKCDIWSLGVITYILISGKMPFHGSNFKETFARIVANKWEFVGDIWKQVTPKCIEFIRVCLTPDPNNRPSAKELLKHAWVVDSMPDVHLQESLESLKKFNAQQKIRAAVRVFCWTQSLLGRSLDQTPPFMRYLRHNDIYSTLVEHQSQTDSKKVHTVDYSKALDHEKPGWKMQDCCTCPSEQVCRHIQNVHEYLFVGKRSMEVFPFIDELKMMLAEAEADLEENPKNKDAADKKRRWLFRLTRRVSFPIS